MARTVRILHISDLHLRHSALTEQRRLLDALRVDVEAAHAERAFQLIVFSGDLAFAGQEAEYAVAQELLFDPLLAATGLQRSRVVLTPGNHDIDRGLISRYTEDGLALNLTDEAAVRTLMDDPLAMEDATRRLSAWRSFQWAFYDGLEEAPEAVGDLAHVQGFDLDGVTVRAASLNSAWRCSGDLDKDRLIIGERQLEPALDAIKDADLRLVVTHHPSSWLTAFEGQAFESRVEASPTLVLTGHEHVGDPMSVRHKRNGALYSRAGCLYESTEYFNGYTVVDVDLDADQVTCGLRRWWYPQRGEFGPAEDVVAGGAITYVWSASQSTSLSQLPPLRTVSAALAEVAQTTSVIADRLDGRTFTDFSDLIVPPRLWPAPFDQLRIAASLADQAEEAPEVRPIDPLAVVSDHQVTLVCGDAESGVSTTMLWLAARHYEQYPTHLPVRVSWPGNFDERKFERQLRRAAGEVGKRIQPDEPLPPLLIALDDIAPDARKGALNALAAYIEAHPEHRWMMGTHADALPGLGAQLDTRGIGSSAVHLGPLGRRELRHLVAKIAAGDAQEITERVLDVIGVERLPRSPFITAVLIAVLDSRADVTSLNVSGILDSYVRLLLGSDEPFDATGLGMDERRREHLLGWLASVLVREGRSELPRLEAEGRVGSFFAERGFGARSSPGKVLDNLIRRRVLAESEEGVHFRHPALQNLFAAKAMGDIEGFAEEMLADPLRHAAIVQHAQGLDRSDASLLRRVADTVAERLEAVAPGLDVDLFDAIENKPGWSSRTPSLDRLRDVLDRSSEPDGEARQQELDELDEAMELEAPDDSPPASTLTDLWEASALVSEVLKTSELVDDLELKASVCALAIRGWSLGAVVFSVREDETAELRRALTEVLRDMGADVDQQRVDRFAELVASLFTSFMVAGSMGNAHLEGVLARVIDDPEVMGSTAPALFTTLLYCNLRFPRWGQRLRDLRLSKGSHPIVRALTETYAVNMYRADALTDPELRALEGMMADVYAEGASGAPAKQRIRAQVIAEMQKSRLQLVVRGAARLDAELEDVTDQASAIEEVTGEIVD